MAADYEPKKWINDPDLKVGDLQPNDESLEMMHRMGVKPEDLKDAKIAKKYREWLAASALKK